MFPLSLHWNLEPLTSRIPSSPPAPVAFSTAPITTRTAITIPNADLA